MKLMKFDKSQNRQENNRVFYLIIYIGFIFLFAIIFQNMSNSFYHSTLKYEQEYNEYLDIIENQVETEIKNNFINKYNNDKIILGNRYIIDINSFDVIMFHFDNFIGFNFLLDILDTKNAAGVLKDFVTEETLFVTYNVECSFNLNRSFITLEDGSILAFGDLSINNSTNIINNETIANAINLGEIFSFSNESVVGMILSQDLKNHFWSVINGNTGFPTEVHGNFFRMLYLSMVTITTLGYGDIVPLTNMARVLIGLESVIGIIILGLFVNSFRNNNKKQT